MILTQIELANYRQYQKDSISIPAPSKDKHIVIIMGRMGFGKTNLLNAIDWCLYGKEPHLGMKQRALPVLCSVTRASLSPGKREKAEVKLTFMDDGSRTEITRTQTFSMRKDGQLEIVRTREGASTELTVSSVDARGDHKFRDYPELYINGKMPEVISPYFLFDGEMLDRYFLEEAVSKIRSAIHDISKLDLMDLVVDHLDKTLTEMDRSLKNPTPEIEAKIKEKEEKETNLAELEKDLVDKRKKKKDLDKDKSELDKALRSSDIEVVRLKQQRLDDLETAAGLSKRAYQEAEDQRRSLIVASFAPAALGDFIASAQEKIATVDASGELPPPYRGIFIDGLLKRRKCICDRPIKEGSEEESTLRKKKQANVTYEAISEHLPFLRNELYELQSETGKILQGLTSILNRMNEAKSELESNRQKQESLSKELEAFENVDIELLEKRSHEVREELDRLTSQIGLKELQKTRDETDLKEIETDLNRLYLKDNKYKEFYTKKDLCQRSLKAARLISEQVLEQIRRQVDESMRAEAVAALNDPKVSKVCIGPDFVPSVKIEGWEEEAIGGLSRGQRTSLALCFLYALNAVSVWKTPIIIDTPIGHVAKEDRTPVLTVLRDKMRGKQIIILPTSAEYTQEVREFLAPAVIQEYTITRNKAGISKVDSYGKAI